MTDNRSSEEQQEINDYLKASTEAWRLFETMRNGVAPKNENIEELTHLAPKIRELMGGSIWHPELYQDITPKEARDFLKNFDALIGAKSHGYSSEGSNVVEKELDPA